jgi:hypothetical protein
VVRQDEKEGGLRAILNLGHTFGHAIETFMGYGVRLHGEAVGVGMCMAAKLALMRNMITDDDFTKIKSLIKENKLPILKPENMTVQDFLSLMVHDKKKIPPAKLKDVDIVVYGHSHKFEAEFKGEKLWLNPGSCGPKRFINPVSMAILEVENEQCCLKKIEVEERVFVNKILEWKKNDLV